MADGQQRHKPKLDCIDFEWRCPKCRALLAWIDGRDRATFRFKYRDYLIYAGNPDWVEVPCRHCGYLNRKVNADRRTTGTSSSDAAEGETRS